ncbi:MAG TPA: Na+/H+ antiporter NhaA [Candidatus Tumulicola sp.]
MKVLKSQALPGFVLVAAALAGLIWANSSIHKSYDDMLHFTLGLGVDVPGVHLTAHDWVNDALMAVFFLLVGLEIKREILDGELSTFGRAALPVIAALGGVAVPAIVCAAFVWRDPARIGGWAIPVATDIAFALAALALVGRGVPPALKVFLTALAVMDDLVAIAIIATFYTKNLAVAALLAGIACFAALAILNRLRATWLPLYLAIGLAMWFCVLQSGVHATLAGVALALTIPSSAVKNLEHRLQPYVGFVILPLFGLFNAGVSFRGLSPAVLVSALPLGIATALFFGKQLGIFAFSWIAVKTRIAPLPQGVTWPMMYGVALLGGIGFTMSLFIGTLAFDSDALLTETKLGVFVGSALAALAGYVVLRRAVARA